MGNKISQPTYTAEKLCKTDSFLHMRDALSAVMSDGEELTIAEAQQRLSEFMKEQVK